MKIKYEIKDWYPIMKPGDLVEVTSLSYPYDHGANNHNIGLIFKLSKNKRNYIDMDEFYSTGLTECCPEDAKGSTNYYKHNLRKLTKEEVKKFKTEGKL